MAQKGQHTATEEKTCKLAKKLQQNVEKLLQDEKTQTSTEPLQVNCFQGTQIGDAHGLDTLVVVIVCD